MIYFPENQRVSRDIQRLSIKIEYTLDGTKIDPQLGLVPARVLHDFLDKLDTLEIMSDGYYVETDAEEKHIIDCIQYVGIGGFGLSDYFTNDIRKYLNRHLNMGFFMVDKKKVGRIVKKIYETGF